jgi:peptidoglycan glycosyltransferase
VPSTHNVQQITRVILIAFFLTAFSLIFWSVLRAESILARDDNPRQVDAVLQIQRGRILDQKGQVLAETIGSDEGLQRHYPLPAIGPAVGYYSFRYGTDGIEDSFNAILQGDQESFWQELSRQALHKTKIGQDVKTTLDAELQTKAEALMADHKGALIFFTQSDESADVVSLVSHPGYDPNQLRASFESLSQDEEAPLLNRITQGQYQPGMVLQPFILAYALEKGFIEANEIIEHPNRPVLVHDSATYCAETAPEPATWEEVLGSRCPGPMLDLAKTLTLPDLNDAFSQFKLTSQPNLPLNTETATYPPLADEAQALIGQDNLIVTPLQVAVAWLALNNNGRLPTLRLVSQFQNDKGIWEVVDLQSEAIETAVSPTTATQILSPLSKTDGITEFSTRVLSGPDGTTNTWYLGATEPGNVVVIVVEDQENLTAIEEIGRDLLTAFSN